jgi:ectoine hydroxylase-related dioxygenase (phytanoyl-CoA dioxygenase family)
VETPHNLEVLARCLGETVCMVPNVNYRLYPPGGPVTGAHQDGFFSPGIDAFRPLWIPLVPMSRDVGGLIVALGEHKNGYFHNLAPGKALRIPQGVINPESWATADYQPGDLLVVHPSSPHAGMPNRSDRLRISLDVRIQSAANPTAFAGIVTAVTPTSISIATDDGGIGDITLNVDADTFIRVLHPGIREPFDRFAEYTQPGMRLTIVRNANRAMMLRSGSNP